MPIIRPMLATAAKLQNAHWHHTHQCDLPSAALGEARLAVIASNSECKHVMRIAYAHTCIQTCTDSQVERLHARKHTYQHIHTHADTRTDAHT